MSKQALDHAWKAPIRDPGTKFVYVALAWQATDDGKVSVDPDTGEVVNGQPPEEMLVLAWAFSQSGLPEHAKFVLVALAYLADGSGAARVDLPDLKGMTSLPALEVKSALRRLAARGLLTLHDGVAHLRHLTVN